MTLNWHTTAPDCVLGRTIGPVLHSRGVHWSSLTAWSLKGERVRSVQIDSLIRTAVQELPNSPYWDRTRRAIQTPSGMHRIRRAIQEHMWARDLARHHGHSQIRCACNLQNGPGCLMPKVLGS